MEKSAILVDSVGPRHEIVHSTDLSHDVSNEHISHDIVTTANLKRETFPLSKDNVIKTSLEIIASIMSDSKDISFDSGNCSSDASSTSDSSDYTSDSESYTSDSDDVSDSYTSDSSDYTTSDSDETLFELKECEAYLRNTFRNSRVIHNSEALQTEPKDSTVSCDDSLKESHTGGYSVKVVDQCISAETASNSKEEDMLLSYAHPQKKQDQKDTASSTRFMNKWILHAKKAVHALYIKAQGTNTETPSSLTN